MSGKSERLPIHDSTPIVKHARAVLFTALLVSFAIVVAVFFKDDAREQRALNQLEIVNGLIAYISSAMRSSDHTDLAPLLADGNSKAGFSTVQNRLMVSQIQHEARIPKDLVCDAFFHLPAAYFVGEREEPINISLNRYNRKQEFFRDYLRISESFMDVNRIPKTLEEFEQLWNYLDNRQAIARSSVPNISKSIVIETNSHARNNPPYNVNKVLEAGELNKPRSELFFGIGELGTGHTRIDATDIDSETALTWLKEGFKYAIRGECFEIQGKITSKSSRQFEVIAPFEMDISGHPWTQTWFNFAKISGEISADLPNRRGKFEKAFRDLSELASSLKTQSIDELEETLRNMKETAGGDLVLFGLALPFGLIKLLGVALICTAQFFCFLHLSELVARMSANPKGDPGAAEAWFILYGSKSAQLATYASLSLPTLACLSFSKEFVRFEFMNLAEIDFWTAVLGIVISGLLAFGCLRCASELKILSAKHRLLPPFKIAVEEVLIPQIKTDEKAPT